MTSQHRALEEGDIVLIERVKERPSLYDPRNPDFRLAYRKEQDWETVSQLMGIEVADARRRWNCLRDRYSRELRQLRLHPESNEYGKNDFFRQMDFLRRFVRKRRDRQRKTLVYKYENSWDGNVDDTKLAMNYNSEQEELEEEQTLEVQPNYGKVEVPMITEFVSDANESYETYDDQQLADSSQSNISPRSVSNTVPVLMPQSSSNSSSYTLTTTNNSPALQPQGGYSSHQLHRSQNEAPTENEDDFFCKSIAAYLRQLSRRHKIKAKVEMFQILEKYIELEENLKSNEQKG